MIAQISYGGGFHMREPSLIWLLLSIRLLPLGAFSKPNPSHFTSFPVARKGVRFGPEENALTYVTRTALMSAAAEGDLEMVRLLLEAGDTAHLKNNLGETALESTERGGHRKVIELLESYP
jgi:hypothetical protein